MSLAARPGRRVWDGPRYSATDTADVQRQGGAHYDLRFVPTAVAWVDDGSTEPVFSDSGWVRHVGEGPADARRTRYRVDSASGRTPPARRLKSLSATRTCLRSACGNLCKGEQGGHRGGVSGIGAEIGADVDGEWRRTRGSIRRFGGRGATCSRRCSRSAGASWRARRRNGRCSRRTGLRAGGCSDK